MTDTEIKNLAADPVLIELTMVEMTKAAAYVLGASATLAVRQAAARALANPSLEVNPFIWLVANDTTVQAAYPNLTANVANIRTVVDTFWPKIWE